MALSPPRAVLTSPPRAELISSPGDRAEREADAVAAGVAGRRPSRATASRAAAPRALPRAVRRAIRTGGGSPLPSGVRARIEAYLGADLAHIRVQGGQIARAAADSVQARAFTSGSTIFLGRGASASDVGLMAHEATHAVQQRACPPHCAMVMRDIGDFLPDLPEVSVEDVLPESVLDLIRDAVRSIPGYNLMTQLIGTDPLGGPPAEASRDAVLEELLSDFGPFGAAVGTVLDTLGVVGDIFTIVQNELSQYDLTLTRIGRDIDSAWDEFSLDNGIDGNVAIVRRRIQAILADVARFVLALVDRIIAMVRAAVIDVAEPLLGTEDIGPVWSLAKKVMHHDPLRGVTVVAPTAEILADFLRLIGEEERLAQMEERGTLQQTADWLDTQFATFANLVEQLVALFAAAWEAIQPENLPNLLDTLPDLIQRAFALFVGVSTFAGTVILKVLELVKDSLLGMLSEHAHAIPGFELLTVIIEQNPFTGEHVERTAAALIGGFIQLMPGGEQIYAEFVETGVIANAIDRIESEMSRLGISLDLVINTFLGIWDTLSLDDLLDPVGAFTRVMDQFAEPLGRLFEFIGVVIETVVTLVLQLMHFPSDLLASIIAKTVQAIEDIQRDPIGFLTNMLEAVKLGFQGFFDNVGTYLLQGLVDWLFRGLRELGITIPTEITVESIFDLILQVLGLSAEFLWRKLGEHIGEERVAMIRDALDMLTGAWAFIRDVQERGVVAIWDYVVDRLSSLWDAILDMALQWIMTEIVENVSARLISMLDPTGVMAVVNSFIAFFNAVQSAIEYIREILEIVNQYVSTLAAIARGDIAPGAEMLEGGLADAIPVAIGFLANQVGLGDVPERIVAIIEQIRHLVEEAIDWLITQALSLGAAALEALGLGHAPGAEEPAEAGPVDPADHEAFARHAAGLLQAAVHGDADSARRMAQQWAIAHEPQLSSLLPEGIGLRFVFPDDNALDGDIDFRVVIAPNTTTFDSQIELEGEVVTIWTVGESHIRLSLDPDDPASGVLVNREASPARALADLMSLDTGLERELAVRFINELNRRGLLRTDQARTLLISFAQTGPGDPLDYLRNNLRRGVASRAARQRPSGAERHQLVDRGTTPEGEQVPSLSNYASVFYESEIGQFTPRQVQARPEEGGIRAMEFVFEGQGQPRVVNLGVVRVADDGAIDQIVEMTSNVENEEHFVRVMRQALWTVRLD